MDNNLFEQPDNSPAVMEQTNIPKVLESAPEILLKNEQSLTNTRKAYEGIEARIKADGMSDLYDTELSSFIEKAKKTLNFSNDRRKPITQIIDMIKKQFTTCESEMKAIIASGQKYRDDYATEKVKAQKALEAARLAEAAKVTEKADLRAALKVAYENCFADIIASEKKKFSDWFEDLHLCDAMPKGEDVFHYAKQYLENWKTYALSQAEILAQWKITLPVGIHHTPQEIQKFASDIKMENLARLERLFADQLALHVQDLMDKLPSKAQELEDLALASAEEAQSILEEQKARKEEEEKRIAAETTKAKEDAAADAAVVAAGEKAAAMVDAVVVDEAPKVAESFNIELKNPAGWPLLFQFWFEKEGRGLASDKLEKFTLLRIKAFCEKYAKDNNEFIQSPVIAYEPIYKAK